MHNNTQMASAKTLRPSNFRCSMLEMPEGHRSRADMPENTSKGHVLTRQKKFYRSCADMPEKLLSGGVSPPAGAAAASPATEGAALPADGAAD